MCEGYALMTDPCKPCTNSVSIAFINTFVKSLRSPWCGLYGIYELSNAVVCGFEILVTLDGQIKYKVILHIMIYTSSPP